MIRIRKVGIISSSWSHAAYLEDGPDKWSFVGYFDHDDKRIVNDYGDRVVVPENEFEVVSVDESAWD